MQNAPTQLNFKKIIVFWLPLAATWLMMSAEGPFLAAVIARLADPKFNLAAYGVAFAFALIIEAPIIMIMSASTALVENKQSFIKLRNYTYFLNIVITILMLIFFIPSIFYFVAVNIIGLPENIADLTYKATLTLLPWPAAIGYRRFYQGILIRNNLTRRVAYGTIIRLVSMTLTAIILYRYEVAGAVVGTVSLSVGVCLEALASRLMVIKVIRNIKNIDEPEKNISYKYITKFYYPLALTSILTLGVHPLVTFFIGQSRLAIESLAILPVVNSLVFIFRSLGLSYQEVAISLVGKEWQGYKMVRNFGYILSFGVVFCMVLIAFTPLSTLWFQTVSGLSGDLTKFSLLPLQILCFMPGFTVLLSMQRAVLVNARKTSPITWATALEVAGIVTILSINIVYFNLVGAVAATTAYMIGRIVANIYLIRPYVNAIKQ